MTLSREPHGGASWQRHLQILLSCACANTSVCTGLVVPNQKFASLQCSSPTRPMQIGGPALLESSTKGCCVPLYLALQHATPWRSFGRSRLPLQSTALGFHSSSCRASKPSGADKDFCDPATASSCGLSHVPSQLESVPSEWFAVIAPSQPLTTFFGNSKYGISTMRARVSEYRETCEHMNWREPFRILQFPHQMCKEVLNLESSLTCRRTLSAEWHGWTAEESSLRNVFR